MMVEIANHRRLVSFSLFTLMHISTKKTAISVASSGWQMLAPVKVILLKIRMLHGKPQSVKATCIFRFGNVSLRPNNVSGCARMTRNGAPA